MERDSDNASFIGAPKCGSNTRDIRRRCVCAPGYGALCWGELFDRIIHKGHYSEKEAVKLIKTIIGAVEACHSLGVMHGDLKPENFLFDSPGKDAQMKATDFGLSVFYKPGQVFCDVVGSPYYVAPEILCKHYGPKVDVWSAGVILYILLSGVPPFWAETEARIFRQILHGKLDFESEPWPSILESAKDLVKEMLERDPKKRISAHELLCHPWIVDDNVAPDKPLSSAVLSRLKHFSAMNKLKKMALRADIDHNGTIDYGEFLAATLHLNKMEREENLVAAFAYFDKDSSGYITIDELQQACKDFGLGDVNPDDISEIDQDHDGRIHYGEFVAMMKGDGSVGRSMTMRGNLNFNLVDALRVKDSS